VLPTTPTVAVRAGIGFFSVACVVCGDGVGSRGVGGIRSAVDPSGSCVPDVVALREEVSRFARADNSKRILAATETIDRGGDRRRFAIRGAGKEGTNAL
jgi:hypothetical protein